MNDVSKYVQGRLDDNYYTPDTPGLFRSKWLPLFVYGSLKKGFYRHQYLEAYPFVGTGFTKNTGWAMFKTANKMLPNYPVIIPAVNEVPAAVFGEIYLVPPSVIRNLDFVESNGVQYHRLFRTVDLNLKGGTRTMAVWMYIATRAAWMEAISQGGIKQCNVSTRKDNKNKYYIFMKKDESASL